VEALLKTFDLTVVDGYMILVVAVLFVILWKALEKTLFIPYIRLIEARERATVGVEEEANAAYSKAEVGERDYLLKIADARKIAMEKKLAIVAKAKGEAAKIADDATKEAERILLSARAEIKKDAEAARKATLLNAEELANDLVSKLKQPPAIVESVLN